MKKISTGCDHAGGSAIGCRPLPTPARKKGATDELCRSAAFAERLAEEHAAIAEIGKVIGSTLDIDEVYDRFAAEVRKLIPFERIIVNSIDAREGSRTVAHIAGTALPGRRGGDWLPLAGSVNDVIVRSRKGLIVQSAQPEIIVARFASLEQVVASGIRSIMVIPLISRNEVIGSLCFHAKSPTAYSSQDLCLSERIGAQIAGAIANARLFCHLRKTEKSLRESEQQQRQERARAERWAEENAIIAEIGRIIGSTLDIEEVYERFANEVKKLISFDRAIVNLKGYREDTRTIAHISGVDLPGRRPGDVLPITGSLTETLSRTRKSLLIQSLDDQEMINRFPSLALAVRAGIRSHLNVPLISRNEVIGMLQFQSKQADAYTEQDARLAERIGSQIAGAIANEQLFNNLRRTEHSLRESENQLKQAERMAHIGNWELDHVEDRISFSDELCRILEVPAAAREALARAVHPEDRASRSDTIAVAVASGTPYEVEYRLLMPDGRIKHVHERGETFRDEARHPTVTAGTIQDITEHRQAEQELINYRQHLEELVRERTRELESKSRRLEELNTALNVLLHKREEDQKLMAERFEFNIRNIIRPYLEKLGKGPLDARQKLCCAIMEANLEKIVSPLLKNLRQFGLTPKESQVASLVKHGRTTKEMAEILGVATGTIDTQRKSIRRKLRLDRKTNLQPYLESLES